MDTFFTLLPLLSVDTLFFVSRLFLRYELLIPPIVLSIHLSSITHPYFPLCLILPQIRYRTYQLFALTFRIASPCHHGHIPYLVALVTTYIVSFV